MCFKKIYILCVSQTNHIPITEVRLMLWDTAGQEEFDALTKSYYRGAQVVMIVIFIMIVIVMKIVMILMMMIMIILVMILMIMTGVIANSYSCPT